MKTNQLYILCCLLSLFVGAQLHAQNVDVTAAMVTVQPGTQMQVMGNVNLNLGGEVTNSGQIVLSGDWTNNSGTTGLVGAATGMVEFNGAFQSIGGSSSTTFYNLSLSGTDSKELLLNTDVDGILNLSDRELLTHANSLHLTDGAAATLVRTSGYVNTSGGGILSRNTNSTATYLFPLGEPGLYRPFELAPTSSSTNTFDGTLVVGSATSDGYDLNNTDGTVCVLNSDYYHLIDRSSGSSSVDMHMYFDSLLDASFNEIGHWQVAPQWQKTSTATASYAASPGLSQVSISAWNDFSYPAFALGASIAAPLVSVAGPTTFCEGDSVELEAAGGYSSYLWSNGKTTPSIYATTSGIYTVEVENAVGCKATSTAITLTVAPLPLADAGSDVSICVGDSTTLTASGGIAYQWSTGEATTSITVNPTVTTTYAVTVDDGLCRAMDAVEVSITPEPVSSFTESSTGFTANFADASTDATTYSWDFGDGGTSTAANPSHSYSAPGNYTVCLIARNSCASDTSCQTITIVQSSLGDENGLALTVYPVPAQSLVFVQLNESLSEEAQLNLYDGAGRLVYSDVLTNGSVGAQLELAHLASGAYQLQLITESQSIHKQLILNR